MSSSIEPSHVPPDDRSKRVLICPVCDHESAVDGDWLSEQRHGAELRSCPSCDAVIERRPSFERTERAVNEHHSAES